MDTIRTTTPRIVVIDDFYRDPGERRAMALSGEMRFHPEVHKGRRGASFTPCPDVQRVFGDVLGQRYRDGYSCFQICTAGEQIVYHSDTQQYAAVVFLTPDAPVASGTSFFRSRKTGLTRAPSLERPEEMIAYLPGAEWENPETGERLAQQIAHDTYAGKLLDRTAWEEVDRVGNRYNRLTVWDARLIHAATDYFGTGLEDGRLFEMTFFDVE